MADEADMAHELEQLALAHALAFRKGGEKLQPRGFCYNCGEPLAPTRDATTLRHERIFCDGGCADDFQRHQVAKVRRVY
jgi:hypothetical protein